ncbi:chemotaxis protein CheY [Marinitoga sp. 1135]|uniref:Protein-glutamate methylesterase/protein-glutamine glutaminase n=1 Tax=Marinitoga piezophila (strain DSM 14283 / JCM 11233 / KA3) TaxID=443254 RepID=H2J4M2_MARPK|nr:MULTISPECIES: chemotaxis response regulator protein-glutamate methylesterase [Marinitoga]AEX85964.1 chemotaxis response regulator containing a CheY-like receiver domain and a methylesterase domain [Marinitoga piezophila KA3]APT76389.1 chemotaxis protein CheY [Marinitoga sp. 1137]NUU96159.1 chemotaxis protein CheY [Marinitoga sp. 1135]NUU98067.1 chemotaxis protein CheY [Marinitoga sp. 1138]
MDDKVIKILIVDDSGFMRMVLKDIIEKQKDMKVVGIAKTGLEGVEKAIQLKPDVITMDVEMPELNGLEAVKIIMKKRPTPIIMVSSLTSKDSEITIEALENGAVDFIQKPAGSVSWTFRTVADELLEKIRNAAKVDVTKMTMRRIKPKKPRISTMLRGQKIVLIASSTGGPRSLDTIIPNLPKGINVPVVVVQHMPPGFTNSLAKRLDKISELHVKEAEDNEELKPDTVYIAPGNYHLGLKASGSKVYTFLDQSDKINNVRPAADFTFDLAAEIYKSNIIAAVLTGMGKDGAKGAFKIKHYGGKIIAESKETCVVYGMPKAVVEENYADFVLPNYEIADKIVELLGGK